VNYGSELNIPARSGRWRLFGRTAASVLAPLLVVLTFFSSFLYPENNVKRDLRPVHGVIHGLFAESLANDGTPGDLEPSQDTTRARPSGVISRRARALERKRTSIDSTDITKNPERQLELIRALPRDSSARLAHFGHVRRDAPSVDPLGLPTNPLYLSDPLTVRSQHNLDSARLVYRVRKVFGGSDIRVPLDYSLDEYRKLRLERLIRKNWEDLSHAYELALDKKKGLGELFGQVTNIEIPVPKNPLFSIFGPNIIRLQINGAVDIHGAFRNTKSDLFQSNPLAQSRSEPDFSQEVQVNVKGEIGDKLKIDADWNTQRTFEYENQLKVRYTGYPDDIVQSIEAGNVSLATNSSFVSSSSALFGIKAGFQFGPLKLTTVASQKKGQVKQLSVSGGGKATPFERRATDYSQDHYVVDTSYIAWFDSAYLYVPAKVNSSKQIKDMEVWVTRIGNEDPNERNVVAFMDQQKVLALQNDPAARRLEYDMVPGEVEVGRFVRLDPSTDYTYHEYAGYITLKRSLQPEQAIAVAYTLPDPFDSKKNTDIGNFGSRDTAKSSKLVMKLVRPQKLGPQYKTAWRMMLKNFYNLGGRGIKKEGFELKILYEIPGKEPQDNILDAFNLIEVFGLDRYGEQQGSPPDGKFDFSPMLTIDEDRGELIFPRAEPFREGIRRYFLSKTLTIAQADSFVFSEVYDTTFNGASNSQRNKFLIRGSTSSSMASTYQVGFNIVEGSVKVLVNGNPAQLGVDYTVDYVSGQVSIKNQALLVPGANLQIQYEANDLLQLASKSLLGARGELDLGKNASFGFTVMNLSQQSLSDKIRLGEEPISNTIFGFDGGTTLNLDFLTRAANWLPGVQTNSPSSLSIKGEAAYMSPDPNTRKSPISIDGGAAVAYVDDFEGARRPIPLGVNFGAWRDASPPDFMSALDQPTKLKNDEKMEYKGKLGWFNISPSDVFATEIWPKKSVRAGEDQVTVLNLWFRPQVRGQFNYSMDLEGKLFANRQKAWSGVQRLIGSTTTNLLDDNINFIELWVHLDKVQPSVKLNIDLGLISEDVIPNGKLNTEDGLDGGYLNGILAPAEEDLGIDGLRDDQERTAYPDFVQKYQQYKDDPSGDDWVRPVASSLRLSDHDGMNGTENNSQSDVGLYPDTEDLNRNNVLDRSNSYFEYEVPLDTTAPEFQQFLGGSNNGWHQIRIPLNGFKRKVGEPSFGTVEGIRVWLTGAQDEVLIRIAEFNLIGNQWEELVKNDTTFRIGVVNLEDNPDYNSPSSLPRQRDPNRPDQTILLNEQSLDLLVSGLKDGESRQAIKRFPTRPLDLFSYRSMRMFVHGDERPATRNHYVDTTNYDLDVFVRFGSDSLNYYEYRAPLQPGWDGNNIDISFAEITAIKLGRDSVGKLSQMIPVRNGPPGATFRVRGQPTLTNVRLIVVGVENPVNKGSTVVTTDVWVNELRLTDVDNTPGWAYRFDTSLKIADIATVAFNMTQRDPSFHSLEDRFGSRNKDRNWAISASLGLERLLPQSWNGTSLAISYSRVEALQNPKYMPGTDILVDEAVSRTADLERQRGTSEKDVQAKADSVRLITQSLNVSETIALPSIKLNVPVDSWLVTETINKLSFSYSLTRSSQRSPVTSSYSQWQWNARMGYGLQFSEKNYISPFSPFGNFFLFRPWKDMKIYFSPRTFSIAATLARGQTTEQARNQTIPKPTVRSFSGTRSMNFAWQLSDGGLVNLGTDYTLDVQSTLLGFELDQLGRQRSFSQILSDMLGKSKLIDFGTDLNYGQSVNLNPRLVVPPILGLDKFITIGARYSARYDWVNNLQAGDLGRGAGNSGMLSGNFDINLKMMGSEIWPQAKPQPDAMVTDSGLVRPSLNLLQSLDRVSRILLKIPIFDFEKVSLQFTQNSRSQNSGVVGRPGFGNFFGRVPFFQNSLVENGPSMMYQLGLASDPHGDVIVKTRGRFPFITGYTLPGIRAPNGNLVDVYSQTNRITMRTSRPLWEGASLEVNWSLDWSYNSNRTLQSDSLGFTTANNTVISGDVGRSYLSFPSFAMFKFLKTSVDEVQKRYVSLLDDPNDLRSKDAKIAEAFENGMEALPFGKKFLSKLMPRPNWTFRWDGLEKLPLVSSFATRISVDHQYTSGFKMRWRIAPTGDEITESQQVTYGFAPLIGINITFKQLLKGNFSSSIRYGTSTSYDLTPSNRNIVQNDLTDISFSMDFARQGFEIPFFGLSLSNDVTIRMTYGYGKNARRLYDLQAEVFRKDGTPLEGSSRTSFEPRIQYVLSSRVTMSVYYKYTKVKPDEGGSRIPGSTTNEGGLDVRVAIQP